jgi:tetratricopeptide (TPR) repeat protein
MLRPSSILVLSFALSPLAIAQDAAPATPPATPTDAVAAAPAEVVDPLVEAAKLIEVSANTFENLKKGIALYEANLGDASRPASARAIGYGDLSRAYFRLGDKLTAKDEKLAAYTKGQVAGQQGMALDAKSPAPLFWSYANLAGIGRTKGVMNSLFMVGDLKAAMAKVLALDPSYHYARSTLGQIEHAVPGIAGGSDDRAEKAYLEALRLDPGFTPVMIQMAQMKLDRGEKDQAKMWAEKAKATKSSVPNDHRKFDRKDADAILAQIQ